MNAEEHNRVLRAAEQRAAELEARLAGLVRPILEQAGREAARNFRARATDHLTASLRRADLAAVAGLPQEARRELAAALTLRADAGVKANSTMICVKPRPGEADAIAYPEGGAAENLHVTLAYLGEIDGDVQPVLDALRAVAADHAPLSGTVAGYGMFAVEGDEWPAILLPDVPGLVELRVAATEALQQAGVDYSRDHGFAAHITLDYVPPGGAEDVFRPDQAGAPLHFDELLLVRGDVEVYPLPLVGVPPVTAAGEPPPWTAPAAAEIVDAAALARKLRAKTEPVRTAVVRSVAGAALGKAGIKFDVTNPLIAGTLAKGAAQIQGISETTQAQVMAIIRESYNQGLSIPDTASAVTAGMADAAGWRSTLIARTELAGAVNGGSLAATQIVASVTGDAYTKTWMTAPGAHFPRHEIDVDLDGQTVGLEEYFDVGGAQLKFPADPDGPPEEVCNCRCTMSYAGQAVAPDDLGG